MACVCMLHDSGTVVCVVCIEWWVGQKCRASEDMHHDSELVSKCAASCCAALYDVLGARCSGGCGGCLRSQLAALHVGGCMAVDTMIKKSGLEITSSGATINKSVVPVRGTPAAVAALSSCNRGKRTPRLRVGA